MKIILIFTIISLLSIYCYSQSLDTLRLREILDQYYLQSNEAIKAGISEEMEHLEWSDFQLSKLPVISFYLNPISFSQSIVSLQDPTTGNYNYTRNHVNNSSAGINVDTPINFTGGRLNINSNLNMMNELSLNRNSFSANVLGVSYSQPIIGGRKNYLFEKKIRRLQFENISKTTKQKHYNVQEQCVKMYISLLSRDIELQNAYKNKQYADTILQLSIIRHANGEITELDLTQAEIQHKQQIISLNDFEFSREQALRTLLVFLNIDIKNYAVQTPLLDIKKEINYNQAIDSVNANNPFWDEKEQRKTEIEQKMYNAKLKRGFNSDINISYGLNQYGTVIKEAYTNPTLRQGATIGVTIPIMDWGKSRNNFQKAKLQKEIANLDLDEDEIKMIEALYFTVLNYNQSRKTLEISEAQTVLTEKQYCMMINNFQLGQNTFYDLQVAYSQLIQSQNEYTKTLSEVWNRYYQIRSMTLNE